MGSTEPETLQMSLRERQALAQVQAGLFERAPRRVELSRYVLLEALGAGGAGVVYAAYDPTLDRKVAIKLLHLERSAGIDESRARAVLLREAQAAAKLSHPNVIAIYDVGEYDLGEDAARRFDPRAGDSPPTRGVFAVLELVEGRTLSETLATEDFDSEQILGLFRAAGRGLAAAHAIGLIHRDFKPANVMVGADGRVRVLDFGLARFEAGLEPEPEGLAAQLGSGSASASSLMQSRAAVGTPAYMAPEQHRGELVDARADQYGFCVALFEALHGQLPFPGETIEALALAKLEGQLRVPDAGRRVPAWIDAVLRRGLAASPAARFDSMDALLAALAGDPRARRRRWLFAGVGFALVLGLGISAQRQRAAASSSCAREAEAALAGVWDEAQRERVAQAFAGTGLPYAKFALASTRAALDTYAAAWTEERRALCERRVSQGAHANDELAQRRSYCLARRLDELGALGANLAEADAAAVERASLAARRLTPLAECRDDEALASGVPRDPALREAVGELEARRLELVASWRLGDFDEGRARAEQLVADARVLGHAPSLADAHAIEASFAVEASELERARAALHAGWQVAERGRDEARATQLVIRLGGVVGYQQGHHEQGVELLTLARAKFQAGAQPPSLDYALSYAEGQLAQARGHWEDSEAAYVHAQAVAGEHFAADDLRRVDVLNALAILALMRDALDDAERDFEAARALAEARLGAEHPHVAMLLNNAGNVAYRRGDYEGAIASYTRALDIRLEAFGPEHLMSGASLGNLANAHLARGELERALELQERALVAYLASLGPDHPSTAMQHSNLGGILDRLGEHEQALAQHDRALALREQLLEPGHLDFHFSYTNRGVALYELGRGEEAAQSFAKALALLRGHYGEDSPMLVEALWGRGVTALDAGELELARAQLSQAQRLAQVEGAGVGDFERARVDFGLARALVELDRPRALELARGAQLAYAGARSARDNADRLAAWIREHE